MALWPAAYFAFLAIYMAGLFAEDFDRLPRWPLTFKREIYPFAPFIALVNLAILTWGDPPGLSYLNYFWTGLFMAGWFLDHDDDDRWKRRKARLAGRVRSAGHRLVVESS